MVMHMSARSTRHLTTSGPASRLVITPEAEGVTGKEHTSIFSVHLQVDPASSAHPSVTDVEHLSSDIFAQPHAGECRQLQKFHHVTCFTTVNIIIRTQTPHPVHGDACLIIFFVNVKCTTRT